MEIFRHSIFMTILCFLNFEKLNVSVFCNPLFSITHFRAWYPLMWNAASTWVAKTLIFFRTSNNLMVAIVAFCVSIASQSSLRLFFPVRLIILKVWNRVGGLREDSVFNDWLTNKFKIFFSDLEGWMISASSHWCAKLLQQYFILHF